MMLHIFPEVSSIYREQNQCSINSAHTKWKYDKQSNTEFPNASFSREESLHGAVRVQLEPEWFGSQCRYDDEHIIRWVYCHTDICSMKVCGPLPTLKELHQKMPAVSICKGFRHSVLPLVCVLYTSAHQNSHKQLHQPFHSYYVLILILQFGSVKLHSSTVSLFIFLNT